MKRRKRPTEDDPREGSGDLASTFDRYRNLDVRQFQIERRNAVGHSMPTLDFYDTKKYYRRKP